MIDRITFAIAAQSGALNDDQHYRRFLTILDGLNYRVELVENGFQGDLCGVIALSHAGTENLAKDYPRWLPVITADRLAEPSLLEHLLIRITVLAKLNQIKRQGLNKAALIAFHSRYKLLLLAYSQPEYRKIGPFVANIAGDDLNAAFEQYRQNVMAILALYSSVKNHINVIQHIQGYFRPYLNGDEKQSMARDIDRFRRGILPLQCIINRLVDYLAQYPNDYLSQQFYLTNYPQILSSCYGDIRCRL